MTEQNADTAQTSPGQWHRATGEQLDYCLAKLREVHERPPHFAPPERPRAMQLVLHLPKAADQRPSRSTVLIAAARATAQLCLDARIAPHGPWHDRYAAWIDSQMRKVARRARGSHWDATAALDQITAQEPPQASVRACVPEPLDSIDPVLARLQVGGTDLEPDQPAAAAPGAIFLLVDDELHMSAGKTAAQVAHAIMLLLPTLPRERIETWLDDGLPLAVCHLDKESWQQACAAADAAAAGVAGVRDAGYTEVEPGSLTVIGVDAVTAPGPVVALLAS